jgi:hypothetical protein
MDLALIVNLITVIALALGILFGLLQLRHYHLSRKREAALLMINSFQTEEFFNGIWIIQGLPVGLTMKEIEERLGEKIKSVYLVISTWERIGILVFNHEISIDIVNDSYSGLIIFSWQRLEKYVTDLRSEIQLETRFEWFQWLAERVMEREKFKPAIPAYLAYPDWES